MSHFGLLSVEGRFKGHNAQLKLSQYNIIFGFFSFFPPIVHIWFICMNLFYICAIYIGCVKQQLECRYCTNEP